MEFIRRSVKGLLVLLVIVLFAAFFFKLGYANGFATAEVLAPHRSQAVESAAGDTPVLQSSSDGGPDTRDTLLFARGAE